MKFEGKIFRILKQLLKKWMWSLDVWGRIQEKKKKTNNLLKSMHDHNVILTDSKKSFSAELQSCLKQLKQ